MPRSKLILPDQLPFTTRIPVRITDVNYGGHVGNDTVLSILHEIRMQFLASYGFTEMDFGGIGTIMSDVTIEFKNELFYGDTIIASVGLANMSNVSFELYYKLEKEGTGKMIPMVFAKTTMVCFDYSRKKVCAIPKAAKEKLSVK